MSLLDAATYVGAIIGLLSIVFNIIQFIWRRNERKILRSQLWAAYNNYYGIALACDKARGMKGTHGKDAVWEMIERITGFVDAGRADIIPIAREYLDLDLKREHPSKPLLRNDIEK